ncbi:MAG: MCE family protein [Sphingobacteriales bacterium]|nr:MAG: MCE family protein [Sphingobacteriales bacterium]
MKFSKEARIGLLVAISFLVFFAGFYFLKGANLFSGENEYYTYFNDIQGLQPAAAVQVKGLAIGRVTKIELNEGNKVRVAIAVSNKVKVTPGTVVNLIGADLLGTKVLSLEVAPGTTEVEDESVLPSKIEGGLLDNISGEISPLIEDLRHVVLVLDTVMVGVNTMLSDTTRRHLESSVASMDVAMKNFAQLSGKLNRESETMASIMRNANSVTSNLAANNREITSIINNANSFSKQLSNAPLEQTFKDLQATSAQLQGLMNKINSNNGSLGLLVNDKALYNNLNQSLSTLDLLMADIKRHPTRYINVTIFGKKKQE